MISRENEEAKPRREHLVESAGYWFDGARKHQAKGEMAEALMCMENSYNHVENALAAARQQPAQKDERKPQWKIVKSEINGNALLENRVGFRFELAADEDYELVCDRLNASIPQPAQKPQEFTWRVGDRLRQPDEGDHWWWTVREIVERGLVITAMNGNGHRHLIDWHKVSKCQNLNASTQTRCADSEDTKRLDWFEKNMNWRYDFAPYPKNLREAIDAAIRSRKK